MDSSKTVQWKKVETNKIHWILNEMQWTIRQKIPDFSGKYYGKLNDKEFKMTRKNKQ